MKKELKIGCCACIFSLLALLLGPGKCRMINFLAFSWVATRTKRLLAKTDRTPTDKEYIAMAY